MMEVDPGGAPVLVTGAAGFLGRAVVAELVRRDVPVRAHAGPPGAPTVDLGPDVDVVEAEITDASAVDALLVGTRAVVHLAGPPSVAGSFADPAGFVAAHVVGTALVVDAAARHRVERLVHVSSAEIYGDPGTTPVREDAVPSPRSPYAVAKLAAEQLVRLLSPHRCLPAIVLRPFSVYGPSAPSTSMVGRLCQLLARREPVELADLRPVRDLVHVEDVARAMVDALVTTAGGDGVPVVNVCSGRGVAVHDVAALALALAGRAGEPVRTSSADRPPAASVAHLVGDPTTARELLGWVPQLSLEDGLAGTLRSFGVRVDR